MLRRQREKKNKGFLAMKKCVARMVLSEQYAALNGWRAALSDFKAEIEKP